MKINVEFLVVTYFISLFVDWVFQWNWQAVNKSKWTLEDDKIISTIAVVSHSFIYATLTTLPLLLIVNFEYNQFSLLWNVLFYSHLFIDTRIPVKWIMRFKGLSWDQINDYQNYGFMHIGIDHRLHELVLLLLAFIV